MARVCLLAVVMCAPPPRLQSTRVSSGIAYKVPSSGHSKDAGMSAAAYDEKLVACEEDNSQEKIIIQGKDQPFVEYYRTFHHFMHDDESQTSTMNCKTFTPPPKPSSTLTNITTPKLPEDVIHLIGSFTDDWRWRCPICQLLSFNMTLLRKCGTASTWHQWTSVQREVWQEGGSCDPIYIAQEAMQTLRTCLASPKANQIAICSMQRPWWGELEWKERKVDDKVYSIQDHLEVIKKSRESIKLRVQKIKENEEMIKENEDSIKYHQKSIKEAQDVITHHQKVIKDDLDVLKQNTVYLEQIFEGP